MSEVNVTIVDAEDDVLNIKIPVMHLRLGESSWRKEVAKFVENALWAQWQAEMRGNF